MSSATPALGRLRSLLAPAEEQDAQASQAQEAPRARLGDGSENGIAAEVVVAGKGSSVRVGGEVGVGVIRGVRVRHPGGAVPELDVAGRDEGADVGGLVAVEGEVAVAELEDLAGAAAGVELDSLAAGVADL